MAAGRIIAGLASIALLMSGAVVATAREGDAPVKPARLRASTPGGGILVGGFTPASPDPRIAAIMARSGLNSSGRFRFTPAGGDSQGRKPVTVAVRARTNRGASLDNPTNPTVGVVPIAYDLGVSVGWKRFAVAAEVKSTETGLLPGGRESTDVAIAYRGRRVTGEVRAGASRPQAGAPPALAELPGYSVDVGGAYSVTRNLAVTAGVRYRAERDRLPRLDDNRRDSQAVYVGTAFRF